LGIDQTALTDYTRTLMDGSIVPCTSYTYGQRLACYHHRIIESLKQQIMSRNGFATTLKYDTIDQQAPCLVYLQLLFEPIEQKLNMYVVFRSHDIFKAALPNGYALSHLLKFYAEQLEIQIGYIEITSISAHIYLSDLYNVDLLIQCLNINYQPEIHLDARGYCLIHPTKNNTLSFEIKSNISNEIIFSMVGTKDQIFQTIMDRKLIVNIEHLKYIYHELSKYG